MKDVDKCQDVSLRCLSLDMRNWELIVHRSAALSGRGNSASRSASVSSLSWMRIAGFSAGTSVEWGRGLWREEGREGEGKEDVTRIGESGSRINGWRAASER